MATSGRGPIKVGSGYIEINTSLSDESVRKFRAEITKQMEKAGADAGKTFSAAAEQGFESLPKAAATAAKKAAASMESEAKDSAETIAKIEADLTRQFGAEADKRFREARQLEEQKQVLVEETSTVTRNALRAAITQETAAAEARSRATVTAERTKQAAAEETARVEAAARQRALEDEARIDREIEATRLRLEQETRAQILETERVRQQERATFLQTQLAETQSVRDNLRNQLAALRTNLAQVEAAQTSALATFKTRLRTMSEATEKLGTTATETGLLITHKLIAPLALAAGAATTFGIKSADAMIQAQTGLQGMHLELKDVNSLLQQMTQYGIKTPYSVADMLTYGTRYARANAAHNKNFNSTDPTKHALGSEQVASRSSQMVQMIGDSAAFGGILDPQMVSQGMYALEVIQDMGRVNLRNLKQLERATGIPAENLAQLVGFQDRAYSKDEIAAMKQRDKKNGIKRTLPTEYSASAQLMDFMANAKDTGGVSGDQIIDSLLEHWNDPKSGIKGAAARMGGATISSRLENMKENAQYQLGQLFYSKDKNGKYKYTGLGESIMGRQVTDKTGTHFEGGMLNDLQDIGRNSMPTLTKLIRAFIEGLSTFLGWINSTAKFLKEHPALTDMILKAAKFAAVMAPVLLGLGTLAKIVGKFGKLGSALLTPVQKTVAGVRGTGRVVSQVRAGVASRRSGGTFREGYTNRRDQYRNADSGGANGIRNQMRDIEVQTRQAEDRIKELKERLKEVNAVNLNALVDEIAGRGDRSVVGAAQRAHTEIHQIQTEGVEPLNRSVLTHIQQEITDTRSKAELLVAEAKNAQQEMVQLDGKKLNALKLTVDGAHGTVTDLKNKVDDTAHSVVLLDGKKLTTLAAEFELVTKAADGTYSKVGNGEGSGNLQGRVKALNDRKLTSLKGQFDKLTAAAKAAFDKIGQGTGSGSLAGRVGLLSGRTLKSIIDQFNKLTSAADDAYQKVGQGTGSGSLAGRIGLLNGRSLKTITGQVNDLKDALKEASDKANDLDSAIQKIGNNTVGGNHSSGSGGSDSGGSKKPKKKLSTGGVLPGYQPGVDSIPAILSPGEAILRPEVTAAIGPATIDMWNAMARKGKVSRFSKGGITKRFGLDKLEEQYQREDIWPLASVALKAMSFDGTSDNIGGNAGQGMLNVGTNVARWDGSNLADRFNGMYQFITKDSWKFMEKLPDGIGQAIGILGGTFAPVLGDYFHDDIWKGKGNIVQRGEKFLGDTFSMKTLTSTAKNLVGGVWDSIKSILGGGSDIIKHPKQAVEDAIGALYDLGKSEVNDVVDMVSAVKNVWNAPLGYADDIISGVWSTAKDAMPNTAGLFDFSDNDSVKSTKPDISSKLGDPPAGPAVARWRGSVQQVLSELGLSQSYTDLVLHRIQVESGGNPDAINNWDSNAKAGHPSQGLMQTIPSTFATYAGPYKGLGITNGLASIYAGLNYAVHRYGSKWPQALSGTKGYWTGTASASPGLALVGERGPELIDFAGGERVYNNRDTSSLLSGPKYEIHIHEAKSEDTTQATMRALKYMENLYGI